jgi:hypothetical protein
MALNFCSLFYKVDPIRIIIGDNEMMAIKFIRGEAEGKRKLQVVDAIVICISTLPW